MLRQLHTPWHAECPGRPLSCGSASAESQPDRANAAHWALSVLTAVFKHVAAATTCEEHAVRLAMSPREDRHVAASGRRAPGHRQPEKGVTSHPRAYVARRGGRASSRARVQGRRLTQRVSVVCTPLATMGRCSAVQTARLTQAHPAASPWATIAHLSRTNATIPFICELL